VTPYDDVSARARGLATHLLSPADWRRLADAPDVPALAALLDRGREPVHVGVPGPDAARVEEAVRQHSAGQLAVLARWCVGRPELLDVIFGEEDLRSLRALVRGAVAGTPSEERLAGTLPTPALPLRALETLAAQPTVAALAALLVTWRHPAAPALDVAPARGPADLLLLDTALVREFAHRAGEAVRRGDAALRWHVGALLDEENVLSALALAGVPSELEAAALIVEGGTVARAALERIAGAGSRLAALQVARAAFRGTALEPAFTETELSRLAERLAAVHDAHLHRWARTDPLSSAPVLDYARRLRSEVRRFQRLAWGLALDAPREERLGEGPLP